MCSYVCYFVNIVQTGTLTEDSLDVLGVLSAEQSYAFKNGLFTFYKL